MVLSTRGRRSKRDWSTAPTQGLSSGSHRVQRSMRSASFGSTPGGRGGLCFCKATASITAMGIMSWNGILPTAISYRTIPKLYTSAGNWYRLLTMISGAVQCTVPTLPDGCMVLTHCMYTSTHVHTRSCAHVHMYTLIACTHVHMYTLIACTHVHMYTLIACTQVHTHCMYTCTHSLHVHMYTCTHSLHVHKYTLVACTHVHMYTLVHVHKYTYTGTHMHTNTRIHFWHAASHTQGHNYRM